MNNKKIFSPSLYIEGLRQLKVIGVVSFIIYVLEAILIPLNRFGAYSAINHQAIIGINNMHPIIYLTYTVLAPIFTLYLFSFLTRRDSSDFYHSIPHKRTCLYVSYIASILTWLLAILVLSSGISIIIHLCLPDIYKINFSMTLPYIAGVFIASTGVVCAVALAQCITGTFLTNIIVSGIIIFFPRVFMEVIIQNILNIIYEIIPEEYFLPLLNGKYNLITGKFTSLFSNSQPDIFKSYSSWIYTIILTLIYFSIGLFCFKKRHSEAAGNSAPNKWLQAVYRICITLTFCLIPISIICSASDDSITIFSIYCIAVVIYFLFEIITTKTVRNLLKILPGLVVIAILNAGIIFFINSVSESELNKCPDTSDVSYIRILADNTSDSYLDALYEQLKIDDNEMIDSIISSLKTDIERCKSSDIAVSNYDYKVFSIHLKNGKTYYRRISTDNITKSVNSTLNDILYDYISKNSEFTEKLNKLPEFKDVAINIYNQNATVEQKENIYNAFLKDYAELSEDEKYALLDNFEYNYGDFEYKLNLDVIYVSFYFNGKLVRFSILINPKYTNTFKVFNNYYYNDEFFNKFKNMLSDIETFASYTAGSASVTLENDDNIIQFDYFDSGDGIQVGDADYTDDVTKELSALSEYIPETTDEFSNSISESHSYIFIRIDYGNKYERLILPETDEITEIFNNLSKISDKIYSMEE